MSPDAQGGGAPVAVCGGGLIGTSVALAAAASGASVRIFDRAPGTRDVLAERLAMLDGPLRAAVTVTTSWAEAARGAGTVVAAVPASAVPAVIAEGARAADPSALLTDVASTKRSVVSAVLAALTAEGPGPTARFVGGHPMAGSERSGPSAADATLFSGATWVLTPTPHTEDAALARAGDLVRALGARVLVLDPEEHDTLVGLVSHLPQLVASVLADVAADAVGADREAVMAVAGPGFRDTTRIAASDPALWLEIIATNRPAILTALEAFTGRLDTALAAVRDEDTAALGALLGRASDARRRLVPKAIDAATRDLVIPLRDRPGEIARITGALGSAGINIEDLVMRHATAADRGSLLLRVRDTSAARAVDVLAAADVAGVRVAEAPASATRDDGDAAGAVEP